MLVSRLLLEWQLWAKLFSPPHETMVTVGSSLHTIRTTTSAGLILLKGWFLVTIGISRFSPFKFLLIGSILKGGHLRLYRFKLALYTFEGSPDMLLLRFDFFPLFFLGGGGILTLRHTGHLGFSLAKVFPSFVFFCHCPTHCFQWIFTRGFGVL